MACVSASTTPSCSNRQEPSIAGICERDLPGGIASGRMALYINAPCKTMKAVAASAAEDLKNLNNRRLRGVRIREARFRETVNQRVQTAQHDQRNGKNDEALHAVEETLREVRIDLAQNA